MGNKFSLKRYVVGPLETNVYLLIDEEGNAVVIDAGPGSLLRLTYLTDRNLIKLRYVLITHAHFDHVCDAHFIREGIGAELVMHYLEGEKLGVAGMMCRSYGFDWEEPTIDIKVKGDEEMEVLGRKLVVLHTPGHTNGSVSYYFPEENIVFTGDTLFRGTVGRWDLPTGSYKDLVKSIKKLVELPPQTRILPGHGPFTTVAQELKENAFIRKHVLGET